jgi:hypothetical protein
MLLKGEQPLPRLMAELQEAKSYLQSEGERIEREMVLVTTWQRSKRRSSAGSRG